MLLSKNWSRPHDECKIPTRTATKSTTIMATSHMSLTVTAMFLHCNAHFLLGLARSLDKSLKALATEPTGRDKHPKFSSSKKEVVVCRLVREACAVLGPRGDEWFSCRDSWIAYCSLQETPSAIPAYKGDRFNNISEAAAAIFFHHQHVQNFLDNYTSQRNWTQDGILCALQCPDVLAALLAIAVIDLRLTKPYWQLLGRPIYCLDFYAHVILKGT